MPMHNTNLQRCLKIWDGEILCHQLLQTSCQDKKIAGPERRWYKWTTVTMLSCSPETAVLRANLFATTQVSKSHLAHNTKVSCSWACTKHGSKTYTQWKGGNCSRVNYSHVHPSSLVTAQVLAMMIMMSNVLMAQRLKSTIAEVQRDIIVLAGLQSCFGHRCEDLSPEGQLQKYAVIFFSQFCGFYAAQKIGRWLQLIFKHQLFAMIKNNVVKTKFLLL